MEKEKSMALDDDDDEQGRQWSILHSLISKTLRQFGTEDHFGKGDYLLVDDNYGPKYHQVEVHRLHMLMPDVIKALQPLLRDFPGWQIIVAVDIPGTEGKWPPMGLRVQLDKIIDDLQREYLPREFQDLRY
jgi:hypothetical protein